MMAVEIEAKMKVDNLATVRSRITACGGTPVGEFLERNVFFDTEDRLLLAADKGLRVRKNHNVKTGADTIVITHKGPRQPGALKTRDEMELEVSSLDDATKLFEALGYQQVLSFEKRRESWTVGKCKVELDEVPHLGAFVEIEGPREDAVMQVREELGLSGQPIVKSSYTALLMTWLQEHGKTQRVVRFSDQAKKAV
jgi:adenylate cyclase, class 2